MSTCLQAMQDESSQLSFCDWTDNLSPASRAVEQLWRRWAALLSFRFDSSDQVLIYEENEPKACYLKREKIEF